MSNIYLLTGFQNWGKTFLIREMFNGRQRFFANRLYPYSGHDFSVQSQSNDDLGRAEFERRIIHRRNSVKNAGLQLTHLVAAFCPTKEPNNDSNAIVSNLFSNDRVFIIPIEYKWCEHAKLQVQKLRNYYANLPNVTIHTLGGRNSVTKWQRLNTLLQPLL